MFVLCIILASRAVQTSLLHHSDWSWQLLDHFQLRLEFFESQCVTCWGYIEILDPCARAGQKPLNV